jgi:hypothetical protein
MIDRKDESNKGVFDLRLLNMSKSSLLLDSNNEDENNNNNMPPPTPAPSSQQQPNKRRNNDRFSIPADPAKFGGGGTLISNSSTNGVTRRFSISRDTSALFDESFYNEQEEQSSSSSSNAANTISKSVDVVSNELRGTYLRETDDVLNIQNRALEAEMANLSFTDKHKIIFDVHGMPQMIDDIDIGINNNDRKLNNDSDDENENIDGYLRQLEEELLKTTGNSSSCDDGNDDDVNQYDNGIAFREAQIMNANYVNGKEFRMMFIRKFVVGDNNNNQQFDVKQASQQIVFHFYVKKMIFGNGEILGRDVRLFDLTKDDIDAMNAGAYQIMPIRDVSGRCVIMYAPNQRKFRNIVNWMRAFWYMHFITARDEENQKSGVVMVYHVDHVTDSYEMIKKAMQVRDALPMTVKAFHYCYNNKKMTPVVTAQRVHFMTKDHRNHFREHFSTDHDEVCFRLETYGITIDKDIFLSNGRLGLDWYNEWFKFRTSLEQQQHNQEGKNTTVTNIILPR